MSIVYVVPIAFTQRITYNNLYFVEGVFLYCFLEENSLLNLCLIVCVSYSLCHLILYQLICVIPHILNKLLLPYYVFFFFFPEVVSPGIPDFLLKECI